MLAAGAFIVATLFVAPTAAAHNVLVGSTPEDGSTITDQPGTIELVFDQAVQEQFAQVTIFDAEETAYETGEPVATANIVTQEVGDLPDGEYTISFRIVSADGHPVTGTLTFTMAAGESGGDAQTTGEAENADEGCPNWPDCGVQETATPAANAGSDDGGISPVVIVGAAAALIVVIGTLAVRRRSGRGPGSPDGEESSDVGETGSP